MYLKGDFKQYDAPSALFPTAAVILHIIVFLICQTLVEIRLKQKCVSKKAEEKHAPKLIRSAQLSQNPFATLRFLQPSY